MLYKVTCAFKFSKNGVDKRNFICKPVFDIKRK